MGLIRHEACFVILFSGKGKQVLLSIQTIQYSTVADNARCIYLDNSWLLNLGIFIVETEQVVIEEQDAKSQ